MLFVFVPLEFVFVFFSLPSRYFFRSLIQNNVLGENVFKTIVFQVLDVVLE